MGAPRSEFGVARYSDRQVQVTLTRDFELGRTEVTRAQWLESGWKVPERSNIVGDVRCTHSKCPVSHVNYYEALEFANRYSERQGLSPCYELGGCTGEIGVDYKCTEVSMRGGDIYACEGYRLPTEAEWEYAARAGHSTAFYSGDIVARKDLDCYEEPNLEPIAWYCANSGGRAHPVAKKRPNGWGLYDMLGNVFEWCADHYTSEGYGQGSLVDPVALKEWENKGSDQDPWMIRVARGGSHVLPPLDAKTNKRSYLVAHRASSGTGFRLARTLVGETAPEAP